MSTRARIQRITTKRLLGQFDYDLVLQRDSTVESSEITILYGDNGSGKTTILNLIYHLLSPARDQGHRSAITEVPFQSFCLVFDDQMALTIEREGTIGPGSYTIILQWPHGTPRKFKFDTDQSPRFNPEGSSREYYKFLETINLSTYFLSADREVSSDLRSDEPDVEEAYQLALFEAEGITRHRQRLRRHRRRFRKTTLEQSLDLATGWIRRQALQGTNRGADTANSIYTNIVRKLVASETLPQYDEKTTPEKLATTIEELSVRYERFQRFRFTSSLEVDNLIGYVRQSSSQTAGIIADILDPYIESLRARLDALEPIQTLTATFVDQLNSFYVNKELRFDVNEGFAIHGHDGARIKLNWLSSGERQLLMLFSHTLLSHESPSIFIIDEPELSLNIKWQRKLIQVLSEIVRGAGTQFLFATHSFELLSQHQDRVVQLSE